MKISNALCALTSLASSVSAYQSFVGSNLYYAAGLSTAEQTTLFTGLQDAGVQVLRVWLDGENSPQKGTNFNSYPSLQGDSPGVYNDEVLNLLDDVMANASKYGIKIIVSLYSYNALENNSDFYGKYYGTGDFYSNPQAISYYKQRVAHVMQHVNPNNGKTWAESSEYIFAFETQNEAAHNNYDANNPAVAWQCDIAGEIKSNLNGNTNILVTTGGSSDLQNSIFPAYFSCDALDMIAIHAYGIGDLDTQKLAPYVTQAVQAGKKLIMEEWGMCYWTSENNDCPVTSSPLDSSTRDSNIKTYGNNIAQAGVPWMYWQMIPNADPHYSYDYEVGINDVNWDALKAAAQSALSVPSQFDFSKYLP